MISVDMITMCPEEAIVIACTWAWSGIIAVRLVGSVVVLCSVAWWNGREGF